jgi:glycosyltransferase involved in cell wall biosynthesis
MASTLRHIAYFSPLPPTRSGIADYSRELLPYLARRADVTLFVAAPQIPDSLRENLTVRRIEDYPLVHCEYDIAIYQMGNSIHHEAIYSTLLRYPGIVVLHEYFLHHFVVACTIGQGSFAGYIREMGYALGPQGLRLACQIRQGTHEPPFFEVPLNNRALDSSLGMIVHSEYMRRHVRKTHCHLPTSVIPHLDLTRRHSSSLLPRKALDCPEDALIFATAGQVTATKQIAPALEAFARLRNEFPEARYAIIGKEPGRNVDLDNWRIQYGLQDSVIYTGYVPDTLRFTSWIAAADVLINLRHPTVGETSGTALRGLATGRPVIVFDVGWYAELPDDVCVKVPPNDIDALTSAMRKLASDRELRQEIGRQAAEYVRRHHDPDRVAEMYTSFVDDVVMSVVHQTTS